MQKLILVILALSCAMVFGRRFQAVPQRPNQINALPLVPLNVDDEHAPVWAENLPAGIPEDSEAEQQQSSKSSSFRQNWVASRNGVSEEENKKSEDFSMFSSSFVSEDEESDIHFTVEGLNEVSNEEEEEEEEDSFYSESEDSEESSDSDSDMEYYEADENVDQLENDEDEDYEEDYEEERVQKQLLGKPEDVDFSEEDSYDEEDVDLSSIHPFEDSEDFDEDSEEETWSY